MDYKKKYKEALERAKKELDACGSQDCDAARQVFRLFPELKESEDENVRKGIISGMKSLQEKGKYTRFANIPMDKVFAWLEKQGEQNYKIIKGKNYFCVKTHNYAGVEWIKGTKYYASDNYTLVNQGCEYYCPEYSKEEHNNLFEEVKCDGCVEKQGEQKPITIDIDKMVSKYSHTKDRDFGLPVNCQIRAYRQGINDALNLSGIKKQGEQKPADKAEPKFEVGDWIVFNGLTLYVKVVVKGFYLTITKDGIVNGYDWNIDNAARLWTINEAKYGDVLVHNSIIFIFVGIENGIVKGICAELSDTILNFGEPEYDNDYCPATKEQRDTLLKSMTDAGYTFDFEKKELKKIDNEIEIPFGAKDSELQEATYYIPKGFHAEIDDDKVVIKKDGKLTAWSEEDEHRLEDTIYFLDTAKKHYASTVELDACIDWLKSLRPQPKQKWSEEDEKMIIKICQDLYDYPRIKSPFDNESFKEAQKEVQFIKSPKPQNNITDEELAQAKKDAYNDALGKIEYHSGEPTFDDGWSAAIDYIRKKYLTPQNKWKPSDEQITWLYRAVDDASKDSRMKQILNELLSDLKKLREG